jgi:hypothetical protein
MTGPSAICVSLAEEVSGLALRYHGGDIDPSHEDAKWLKIAPDPCSKK